MHFLAVLMTAPADFLYFVLVRGIHPKHLFNSMENLIQLASLDFILFVEWNMELKVFMYLPQQTDVESNQNELF